MYKNLKFSWAHILLFLAVIYIGYVTYVGLTYKLDNGLTQPLFYTFGILLVLIIWFMGAQQLKGVDNNFNFSRCIWGERIFVFTSPIIFALCLIPLNHAWNVASHSDDIETKFKNAINSSTKMFDDYDSYSKDRIAKYADLLQRVKNNKDIQPTLYKQIGFNGKNDDRKVNIEVETLKRQLTSKYDSLSVEARSWIVRADQSTSVWNIFLIGNIKEIKTAITDWNQQMRGFSSVILTTEIYDEGKEVVPFDGNSENINETLKELDSLANIYTADDGLSTIAIILGVILYFMMISPYFVQKRNGVSTYTLLGRRFVDGGLDITTTKTKKSKKTEIGPIDMGDEIGSRNSKSLQVETDTDISVSPVFDDEEDEELDKEQRRRKRRERRNKRESENENRHRRHENEDDDDSPITSIEDIQ